jgi:Tol biopolymer transport system component
VLSSGWNNIDGLAWQPEGKEVWFTAARTGSARALWAVDLDGRLRPLAATPGAMSIMGVSRDGRALINCFRRRSSMTVMQAGASTERDVSWLDYSAIADIAADGRSILFTEEAEGGGARGAVYLWELSKPEPVRLGEGRAIALSQDGRSVIAFDAALPKQLTILPTGAGLPRHVNLPFTLRWATFLPDGDHALMSGMEGTTPQRIFIVDLRNGSSQALTPPNTWLCATSPDGSEFVVKEGSSGRALIYSFRGGAPRVVPGVQALTSRDFPLQWSADGRSLYVQASTDTEREIEIDLVDIGTGTRRPWKRLVASDPASFYSFEPDVRITRDGSAYAYSCPRYLSDLYLVDGLR